MITVERHAAPFMPASAPLRSNPVIPAAALRPQHRLDLSDYLLLTGVALVPFVSPIPGPMGTTPPTWTDRITLSDGFFVLAMMVALWQRLRQELDAWFNRRPHGYSHRAASFRPTWALPRRCSVWYLTAAVLTAMVLSWFANPLIPFNVRMISAMFVQIYLACVGVFVASAVYRYGTPAPILVAWVIGFFILSVICAYDSLALMTHRTMIYPGLESRLRGPFRSSGQLGGYALSSFFILLAAAKFVSHRWISKAGWLACFAPVLIVLASRRSAAASLIIAYISLLIVSQNRIRIFLGTAVPAAVVFGGLFFFGPPETRDYIMARSRPLTGQDQARVDITLDHFTRAVSAFEEHPVLGVGFGAFSSTRFGELTESITHEQHSGYLAILAETGAVGFGLMMLLHLSVLEQLGRAWLQAVGKYRDLITYLFVVLVAFGVAEVYNRIWRDRGMWIVVGMIAALPVLARQDRLARIAHLMSLKKIPRFKGALTRDA